MGLHAAMKVRVDAHGLGGLVGTPPRFYPTTEAPQKVPLPFVTYQQVSGPRVHAMGADVAAQPRIQFDCWGAKRIDALAVRDQVLACFDRWSGSFAGLTILSSLVENEGMDIERDDDTTLPRATVDVIVSYLR